MSAFYFSLDESTEYLAVAARLETRLTITFLQQRLFDRPMVCTEVGGIGARTGVGDNFF